MATDASVINAIGFNCKSIKSNFNYVEHLLQNECAILFLCEHWLKPSELYETNNMIREQDLWCNLNQVSLLMRYSLADLLVELDLYV